MIKDKYFMDFVAEALMMQHKLKIELEKIQNGNRSSEVFYETYRLAHSLNSSSSMAGLPELGSIAAYIESPLEAFAEDSQTPWPEGLLELCQLTNETIGSMLNDLNAGREPDIGDALQTIAEVWTEFSLEIEPPKKNEELASVVADFFLIEADEHLKTMSNGFLALEKNPTDKSVIEEVFRAAHTLKGAASSVGFTATEIASHALEDVLEPIRDGDINLNASKIDILLGSLDALKETLDLETKGDKSATKVAKQVADLVGTIGVPVEKAPAKTQVFFPTEEKKSHKEPDVRVRLSKLDNLMNLTGELLVQRSGLDESRAKFMTIADLIRLSLRRLSSLTTDLSQHRLLQRTTEAMNTKIGSRNGSGSRFASEFDELEFDRYIELDRIIRNQTEVHADLVETLTRLEDTIDDLGTGTSKLIQNVTSIQDSVIGSRLISISQVLDRFPRMVRDLARSEGKQVNLAIEGETVEIDVKVADKIYDPLLHIIRNAVHHGIETPKTRESLGKSPEGNITLSASYEGNQVILRISNDGTPLDTDRIAQKALGLGLATKDEIDGMDHHEINRLIFKSGLSTSDDAGMVAGRGVGLDVVKTNVENLGGTIDVDSNPLGTEFTLKLPISLVISQGLVVSCHSTPFVIPLGQVSEVMNILKGEIKLIGETRMFNLRDEFIPVHFLDELLGMNRQIEYETLIPAVIVEHGNSRMLVRVSDIQGKHDMVIKSMPRMLHPIDIFAGATIFGSGQVVLVLNPRSLFEARTETAKKPPRPEQPRVDVRKTVLVVDDSLSMRKILSHDLEDSGFDVHTAASGLEALDELESNDFDLLVLDIEMPEMDGFELLSILKEDPRFSRLPNMIITSRSGQKHRSKAFDLGANAYLVKPYDQQLFLETVKKLLSNGNGG